MKKNTVLISGASIAGPALAYWLHRHGFAVTVVERAPGIRPGGHAVDIRGVAKDVCARMGIMPQITRDRVHEEGFAWVDASGRRTSEMPATLAGGEGLVAEYEILRGDLADILYDLTRGDVEYRFGDRITALTDGADGVKVEFRGGRTEVYDLVVGADGVHSGVRALAFGPEERFIKQLGAYTAYFTMPAQADLDPHWFLMHGVPGGRCAGIRPENDRTAKAMLTFRAEGRVVDPRDVEAQKRLLAQVYAGDGWRVPAMLDAMWDAPDFYFDVVGQVHMPHWTSGRVALLGDAGYCASPISGLGTSLSLVGAYVLAGELAAAGGDHTIAYAAYEEQLRGYVTQCQKLPPGGVNGMLPMSAGAIRLRDLSTRVMTRRPFSRLLQIQAGKADAITLQSY
ncbi:FAD-dependent monooxygenase [Catellatospora chokoriensis]|uniref:FAD-dependent oxidoreductase n=1 Tax=Catellatospora chokoriensis TaxID=310353 RepID=A0A8J3K7W1_9ACTN|nr:FAD-dependent monooxygenase [Catellatospora chokoriensis]GIF91803.1 FAD-dependent oxidoreductase [Catellatospora chokoriensis]